MTSFMSCYAGSMARPLYGRPYSVQNVDIPKEEVPKNEVCLKYAQDVYRYQTLYTKVLRQMQTYMNLYASGSFNELRQVFNETTLKNLIDFNQESNYYNKTITDLKDFTYDETTFNAYRTNMYSIFNGFSKSIQQTEKVESLTVELNEAKELLSDKDKLIEYIRLNCEDRMMMESFSITQPYNTQAILKPWYTKYFYMFGPPPDGVFDTEKMAMVVDLLIQEKVITMDDFIQNHG